MRTLNRISRTTNTIIRIIRALNRIGRTHVTILRTGSSVITQCRY